MPLAGGFYSADDPRADETYPLTLVRCTNCTLMQVLEVVPPERVFTQYSYASSASPTLVRHFETLAGELAALAGGGPLVEFGCNDGILVRPLAASGATVIGVDPSDVARRASEEQGWPLYEAYFNAAVAERIRDKYGPAAVVTGNNVCAHVDDLHALLEGVTTLLAPDGRFAFEVHYQGDLIDQVQYDTVYHEHTCYHSLTGLARWLDRHGMSIIDVSRIPIHSGSIHVTAARNAEAPKPTPAVGAMLEQEKTWDISCFADRVNIRRESLRTLVEDLNRAGRRVVGYGASGRATVLLNSCGLGPALVDNVSDVSPLRYGKVIPGVRIPIVSREEFHADPPDYAILTAWNYEPEITRDEQDFLRSGGRFIIPLPEVRLAGAR